MPPRGPTAYFLFAGEIREAVQKEIAADNNGKAGVAAVGKAIGQRWHALTDEDRQSYRDRASQKAAELKEHQRLAGSADGEQNNADGGECNAAKPSGGPPPLPPFDLPTSLVKKIACMDSEVDRMTADAVRAMAKATSLFIGLLATKAYTHAAHLKRKNFKFSDIEAVASKDRRMGDMGLPQTLREDAVFQEVHGRADAENQNRTANKNKRDAIKTGEGDGEEVKEKIRPLTDFFATSGATTGALLSVHALEETAEDEEV